VNIHVFPQKSTNCSYQRNPYFFTCLRTRVKLFYHLIELDFSEISKSQKEKRKKEKEKEKWLVIVFLVRIFQLIKGISPTSSWLQLADIGGKEISWWSALLLHQYPQCGGHSKPIVIGHCWMGLSILPWLK